MVVAAHKEKRANTADEKIFLDCDDAAEEEEEEGSKDPNVWGSSGVTTIACGLLNVGARVPVLVSSDNVVEEAMDGAREGADERAFLSESKRTREIKPRSFMRNHTSSFSSNCPLLPQTSPFSCVDSNDPVSVTNSAGLVALPVKLLPKPFLPLSVIVKRYQPGRRSVKLTDDSPSGLVEVPFQTANGVQVSSSTASVSFDE